VFGQLVERIDGFFGVRPGNADRFGVGKGVHLIVAAAGAKHGQSSLTSGDRWSLAAEPFDNFRNHRRRQIGLVLHLKLARIDQARRPSFAIWH
jgi:hypothetical protein